ncbi:phage tail fiber protein [Xenorhabdus miraniensis]|uniref:Phage tail fiber protein n=2 Tax=Xenorhabdus miraniensis TaxID=351674 RepID=A0A2D0JML5_9GAMM|nr:phage tail fiber protein [Xenorhabdus miraniensis]
MEGKLDKGQNGADIPDKAAFVRNIGAATQGWVIDNAAGYIKYNIIDVNINEFTSWITSRPQGGHAFRFSNGSGGTGLPWSCGYVTRI